MDILHIFSIYNQAIEDYHIEDRLVDIFDIPFELNSFDYFLYQKAFIDTIQWHCEDEVRHPDIEAEKVRYFKNRIDSLNQERTNLVEKIDDILWEKFQVIHPNSNARLATESPAWSLDRLSILALKIYHMNIEAKRNDLTTENRIAYQSKLAMLMTQKQDLILAITTLISEIEKGETMYKLYRQVKMYNDQDLNPVLRKK